MSRGPGRLERAIRVLFEAKTDEAFSTDDLCEVCYPGVPSYTSQLVTDDTISLEPGMQRKHRVAVLRAANKVLRGLPDWRVTAANGLGPTSVFFNAASVPSTAKAHFMRHYLNRPAWRGRDTWDEPKRLAEAEQAVAKHVVMRDGTDEERRQLTEREEAEHQLRMAKLQYAAAVSRNPVGVLLSGSRIASDNISELAEKARKLITENDPDAIREGLKAIATALDAIARETKDPMATIEERLAA
jgi:hypothetical protein